MHSNPRFISVGRPASIASRNSEAQWSWPGGRGRSQSNPPLDPMFPTWSTSHVLVLVSAIFSRQSFGIFATICIIPTSHAPVAQLDRVPGYEPGGRAFESLRARHTNRKGLPFFGRPFLFPKFLHASVWPSIHLSVRIALTTAREKRNGQERSASMSC